MYAGFSSTISAPAFFSSGVEPSVFSCSASSSSIFITSKTLDVEGSSLIDVTCGLMLISIRAYFILVISAVTASTFKGSPIVLAIRLKASSSQCSSFRLYSCIQIGMLVILFVKISIPGFHFCIMI